MHPIKLIGVAMRRLATGEVISQYGFDGGHGAVWSQIKATTFESEYWRDRNYEDGFITSEDKFVNRADALEIAKAYHQWNGLNRYGNEPCGRPGLMSEAVAY